MLLKGLAADVEGKVIGVDHPLKEVEVARKELVELVRDENLADVQLEPSLVVL